MALTLAQGQGVPGSGFCGAMAAMAAHKKVWEPLRRVWEPLRKVWEPLRKGYKPGTICAAEPGLAATRTKLRCQIMAMREK